MRHPDGRRTVGQGVYLRMLCWAWLHDVAPTDHTGLISWNGTERAAYQVWKSLASSRG